MGIYLSSKDSQKRLDNSKQSATTRWIWNYYKETIQKTAEATGDWIGIKTANKITSVPGTSVLQHWWNRNYMIW